MKTRILPAAALALALIGAGPPASAQWLVYDPTNFSQNVLTAARTLEQINNQVRSLQNEAQMLLNQARNLTTLPTSVMGQLGSTLTQTQQLIAQAQGLTFDVARMEAEFRRLYPGSGGASGSGPQLVQDARERWTTSLEALRTTVQVQAQVSQAIERDQSTLADLVGRSQGAVGLLQAVQATNQLLALQSAQGLRDQQLRLAEGRATALEQARAHAVDEQARAVRERFQGSGTAYSPSPVRFTH